jgi:excisionase family DNA binding protein
MLSPDRDIPRRTLVTVQEVALMLGCGRTLVYDLIGSRQLPVVKIGRLTRVPVAAVDDFVSRHVTGAMSHPVAVLAANHARARSAPSPAIKARGVAQIELFDEQPGRRSEAIPRRRGHSGAGGD